MSCSNFVAKTFAHAAAMLAVSAAGSTRAFPFATEGKLTQVAIAVGMILALVGLLYMPPGILKYVAAAVLAYLLGTTMHTLVQKLKMEDTLYKTLVYTAAISIGVVCLAFMDTRGKFISFGPVLGMSLFVLLLSNLYFYFAEKSRPEWISTAAAVLFSAFIAYDTELVRKHALSCVAGSADYINESFGLYLDALNLFSNLGD